MEEEQRNTTPEPNPEEIRPVKKPGKMTRGIHDIIGGDLLSKQAVLRNLPFLIFLAILAMFYIGNTYYTEKTFKQIEKIKNELKELRYQSITVKAKMLDVCKQTEIAKKVEGLGIKVTTTQPYKIFYSKALLKKETDTLHRNP
jgi:Bacteriodetes cell division protein (FtsL-like)